MCHVYVRVMYVSIRLMICLDISVCSYHHKFTSVSLYIISLLYISQHVHRSSLSTNIFICVMLFYFFHPLVHSPKYVYKSHRIHVWYIYLHLP